MFWSKCHGVFKALPMRKQSQPSELEHAITSVDHPYCSILLQQEIHTTLDRHPPLNFKYLLYANKLLWNDLYSYLKLWKIQYNKKNYFLTFIYDLTYFSPKYTFYCPTISKQRSEKVTIRWSLFSSSPNFPKLLLAQLPDTSGHTLVLSLPSQKVHKKFWIQWIS